MDNIANLVFSIAPINSPFIPAKQQWNRRRMNRAGNGIRSIKRRKAKLLGFAPSWNNRTIHEWVISPA